MKTLSGHVTNEKKSSFFCAPQLQIANFFSMNVARLSEKEEAKVGSIVKPCGCAGERKINTNCCFKIRCLSCKTAEFSTERKAFKHASVMRRSENANAARVDDGLYSDNR